jgi:subtilisin family serine protease
VLDSTGFGRLSELLRGLQWLYDTDIWLANMSIQFRADYHPLKVAIRRLSKKGVIMVAAAGNRCASGPPDEGGGDDGGTCDPSQYDVAYPAAYPGVIAVGAIDYYNRVTAYSRSGSTLDMVAPGGSQATGIRILSTYPDDGYGYGSGTSQATAHVTGICALVLQMEPHLPFDAVLNYLKTHNSLDDPSTYEPYPPERQGDGLVNAEETVDALQ